MIRTIIEVVGDRLQGIIKIIVMIFILTHRMGTGVGMVVDT